MPKIKVKASAIGVSTNTEALGNITIAERHADILAREGKLEFLEGAKPAKKLVPVGEKSFKALREEAKDLPGFHLKLSKEELIALIDDTTPN